MLFWTWSYILFRASWLEEEESADKSWLKIKTLAFVLLSATTDSVYNFSHTNYTKYQKKIEKIDPSSFLEIWFCYALHFFPRLHRSPTFNIGLPSSVL